MQITVKRTHSSIKFLSFILTAFLLQANPHSANAQEPAVEHSDAETLSQPITAVSDSGVYKHINEIPESIRRSRPFARDFHEMARRAGSSGVIDQAGYLQAFQQAQQNLLRSSENAALKSSHSTSLSGIWTNIETSNSDTVKIAGCTSAIVFDPKHPNIMYAGGSGGGVWKSLDTGATWAPLTDNILPNSAIASIAVDPVNTNILYVGTGYCYSANVSYNGSGLYKSSDGGGTWQKLTVPGNAQSYVKILVHPTKDNIVFASSFDGAHSLYRSTDGGSTWTSVLSQGVVWDLVAAPAPNGATTFYAIDGSNTSSGIGTSTAGVYKSIDDGATWSRVTTSSNFPSSSNTGRAAIASPLMAPNKIFALMSDRVGDSVWLYRSTDSGANWTQLDVPQSLFQPNISNAGQGWYDLYLAVTPNSIQFDTLYIGGVEAYVNYGHGGGWLNFSGYSQNLPHSSPHVDHHSFAINPVNSNIVYDGDDGGVYRNTNAGEGDIWQYWSTGMITNRFYHIGIWHSSSNVTWAGAQDQGTWQFVKDSIAKVPGPGGDGMQPIVSTGNANGTTVFAEDIDGQVFETLNGGGSWRTITNSSVLTDEAGWNSPFKMSPINHGTTSAYQILYLGRQYLWQSTNGGNSWTRLNVSFSQSSDLDYTTAIGLTTFNSNLIYAAGYNNQFKTSKDFGATWTPNHTLPGGKVTSIATSWRDTNLVVISLDGNATKVMMSDNQALTWTNVSGTTGAMLPNCNIESVALDSLAPLTTWYAGTDFGMYFTTDAGQHWYASAGGLGLFPCRDVQICPNKTTIRVATFGRGIWEALLPLAPTNGVEWTSLSAQKTTNGTALSWFTQGEPSGATFYVERSFDGNAFESIGSIPGEGASQYRHDYSYTDPAALPGTYLYHIHEVNTDGTEIQTNNVELHYGLDQLLSYQSYPNPFVVNGSTAAAIQYELPGRDEVTIRIFNITGAPIRTLFASHYREGGIQTEQWDGRDDAGVLVPAGAYLYSIQTNQYGTMTNKMVVVRE
jgi:photosystem II stability/assembly factor-like uncharacterized protein